MERQHADPVGTGVHVDRADCEWPATHRLSIRLLAPSLLRLSLSAMLSPIPGLVVVDGRAAVSIVAGKGWEHQVRELLTGTVEDRPPGIVLICGSELDLGLAGLLGIRALVSEEDSLETLLAALQAAVRDEAYCSSRVLPGLLGALRRVPSHRGPECEPVGYSLLSMRELEVARKVAQGLTNDQVARLLHVSLPTVKFHLKQVYRKLGISCRSRLAYLLADIRDDSLSSEPGN